VAPKTSVEKLYGEIWAEEGPAFDESLNPRGTDWLFEAFAELGPRPGQLVVDIGARDAQSGSCGTTASARSRSIRSRTMSTSHGAQSLRPK
jgi:hypothetical protein